MNRLIAAVFVVLAAATCAQAKTYEEMFGRVPVRSDPAKQAVLKSMNFGQGAIEIEQAHAKLQVPAGFYYLDSTDTIKLGPVDKVDSQII